MGRNNNPGSLRNRNRITPKTRLKIHKGDIDAEPVVLEEDEEKARVVSTAGVDAEDANVRRSRCYSQRRRPLCETTRVAP
jgi:enhancer of polycomb-like protein